jgi:hypothetical protein
VQPIPRLLRAVLFAGVAFVLVTWLALEAGDVGVLQTVEPGGVTRETRVWWAAGEGRSLWLEAATPDRPWLLDLRHEGAVVFSRGEDASEWHAALVEGEEARQHVRSLLRAKYGWTDRWVALVQDTSQAVAVRLDPR